MAEKMRKKLPIKWIVVALAVVAAIAGGAVFARNQVTKKAVSVYPVSSMAGYGWFDNETSWGTVTDSAVQEIRLGSSLVDSVKAKVGAKVKKGDVLMKYNKESVKLAVQADEASIALLKAQIESANAEIGRYQSLHPSEEMPQGYEKVIHHKAEPVTTVSEIDVTTPPSETTEEGMIYYCTKDTKVLAAMLQYLDDQDLTAEFRIYENNVVIGSWQVDGSRISSGTKIIYIEKEPDDPDDPVDPTDPADPTEPTDPTNPEEPSEAPAVQVVNAPSKSPARSSVSVRETRREEAGPYEDWIVGEGVEFIGDGTVSVDYSTKHYGRLISVVPEEAEWDEVIFIEPDVDTSGDNYLFSRKELAQMVEDKSKEIRNLELDLKSAELKLKEDKLISADGKVLAAMDGVITEVKDPSEVKTGEPLIAVKGTGGFTITAQISEYDIRDLNIGDLMQVMTYESASAFSAEISHISMEPSEESMHHGRDVSYYNVTAVAMDDSLELRRGEGCEITLVKEEADFSAQPLILPTMMVRKDDMGSYCMIADENNRLKRVAVQTGKIMWGDSIEIRSGITEEDRIAFPYGKNVKDGSPVVDKDNIYNE